MTCLCMVNYCQLMFQVEAPIVVIKRRLETFETFMMIVISCLNGVAWVIGLQFCRRQKL